MDHLRDLLCGVCWERCYIDSGGKNALWGWLEVLWVVCCGMCWKVLSGVSDEVWSVLQVMLGRLCRGE